MPETTPMRDRRHDEDCSVAAVNDSLHQHREIGKFYAGPESLEPARDEEVRSELIMTSDLFVESCLKLGRVTAGRTRVTAGRTNDENG